jgi:hypothetical protein
VSQIENILLNTENKRIIGVLTELGVTDAVSNTFNAIFDVFTKAAELLVRNISG